jgi:hypothetical protein
LKPAKKRDNLRHMTARTFAVASLALVSILVGGLFFLIFNMGPLGPGAFDYRMHVIGEYSIFRPFSARSLEGPMGLGSDITQLGWSNRYIVCYRSYFEATTQPYDQPLTEQCYQVDRPASGWWIIDTGPSPHRRYGPFTESARKATLRQLGAGEIAVLPVPLGKDREKQVVHFGEGSLHERTLE